MAKIKWERDQLLAAWVKHSRIKEWSKFHDAMNHSCLSDTGRAVNIDEGSLNRRLIAIARSLDKAGYAAPTRPTRPSSKKTSGIADAAARFGLKKKK